MLDTYGEQARLGKIIGGDIQQRKKTILYLTALQNLDGDSTKFISLYNSELPLDEKLPQVRSMMEEVGVQKKISKMKNNYLQKALDSLSKIEAKNEKGMLELEKLSAFIINRHQ